MRASFLIFAGLVFAPTTWAQDEANPFEDLLGDEEEDLAPTPPVDPTTPPSPVPDFEFDEPEDDTLGDPTDPLDPLAPPDDLLGEDPNRDNLGGDSAELYRQTLETVSTMDPDDEAQVWDEYLLKYPITPFRPQIESRQAELETAIYNMDPLKRPGDEEPVDNDKKQLAFSQGLLIENINPRRRVQLTIEWGLPDYANLGIDYEHALSRDFSIHAGLRRRFTGFSIEGGARWALVKSARTNTLVTAIMDVRLNADPAFVGFRPILAAGKRFGKLDLQGQVGAEVSPRAKVDTRIIGGLNTTYRASKAVGLFAETSLYMKTISGDAGPFRFNQFTFGMKFFPSQKSKNPENVEVNMGASIPYSSAYWAYHFGSIMGQANIYLD